MALKDIIYPKVLLERQAALFYKADPDYGTRAAAGLGLDQILVKQLALMTQEDLVKATANQTSNQFQEIAK